MARNWLVSGAALATLGLLPALLMGGCSSSTTRLPDAASMPTRASADADRARHTKSMGETAAAASARQVEAAGKIEGAR
ncbi:MAG: hypothetical protein ABL908_01140 [Hyphomicrobium sp.]